MINNNLIKEAIEGHQKFLHAVENDLHERCELGRNLLATLDAIDEDMNEEVEIVTALLPINLSSAELKAIKETTLKYAEAWNNWTLIVREDIRKFGSQ